MSLLLCEAQAEVTAAHFQGIESPLLARGGTERSETDLTYTSLPGMVKKLLPTYHLAETVHLLCDHALMTFAPDEAFIFGLQFLMRRRCPVRIQDWNDTRRELGEACALEGQSIQMLKADVEKQMRVYSKHKDHIFMNLFLKRFERGFKAIEFRRTNPMGLFPWDRTVKSLSEDLLSVVPAPYVKFVDGPRSMGTTEETEIHNQTVLSSLARFFEVMLGGAEAKCRYIDDDIACVFERTPACAQYPWSRGFVADSAFCNMGMPGYVLDLLNSHFEFRK